MGLRQQQVTTVAVFALVAWGCGDDSPGSVGVPDGGDAAVIGDSSTSSAGDEDTTSTTSTTGTTGVTNPGTGSDTGEDIDVVASADTTEVDASVDTTEVDEGDASADQTDGTEVDASVDTTEGTNTSTSATSNTSTSNTSTSTTSNTSTSTTSNTSTSTTSNTSTSTTGNTSTSTTGNTSTSTTGDASTSTTGDASTGTIEPGPDASDATTDDTPDADVSTEPATTDDPSAELDASADEGEEDAGSSGDATSDASDDTTGEEGTVWEQTLFAGVLSATGENLITEDPAGTFCISGEAAGSVGFKYNVNQPVSGGALGTFSPENQLDLLRLDITGLDYTLRLVTEDKEYCADVTDGTESVVFNAFYECGEETVTDTFHYHLFPILSVVVAAESAGPYQFCVSALDAEIIDPV